MSSPHFQGWLGRVAWEWEIVNMSPAVDRFCFASILRKSVAAAQWCSEGLHEGVFWI